MVEDDLKVARFLTKVLHEEGLVTDICTRGQDAIRQISKSGYDLVVLDWMLPDIDGLSVCREIRRAGSWTPVMMLTARNEVHERVLREVARRRQREAMERLQERLRHQFEVKVLDRELAGARKRDGR